MKRIITIIGARPQIIKSAALSRAIKTKYADQLIEVLVHTGQHYDEQMSEVFFTELGLSKPDYNLNIGSGSHGSQTAEMIKGLEDLFLKEKDRKSTRLNSSHVRISYAVFCLKKKKKTQY